MGKRVRYNGVIHEFPDDATDEEIRSVLEASEIPTAPAKPAGPLPAKVTTVRDILSRIGSESPETAWEKIKRFGMTALDTEPEAETGMGGLAGQLLGAVTMGTVRGSSLIPSVERAGQKFKAVEAAAKDIPINLGPAEKIAARAQELRQRGSSMPKVMNDFIKNRKAAATTSQPFGDLMTYKEGRDFASAAGAMSTREVTAMNASMQRQVGQFAQALKTANREAAEKVGMGKLYDLAMKEYRQAKNLAEFQEGIKAHAIDWGLKLGLTGIGAYALGKEIEKHFR